MSFLVLSGGQVAAQLRDGVLRLFRMDLGWECVAAVRGPPGPGGLICATARNSLLLHDREDELTREVGQDCLAVRALDLGGNLDALAACERFVVGVRGSTIALYSFERGCLLRSFDAAWARPGYLRVSESTIWAENNGEELWRTDLSGHRLGPISRRTCIRGST